MGKGIIKKNGQDDKQAKYKGRADKDGVKIQSKLIAQRKGLQTIALGSKCPVLIVTLAIKTNHKGPIDHAMVHPLTTCPSLPNPDLPYPSARTLLSKTQIRGDLYFSWLLMVGFNDRGKKWHLDRVWKLLMIYKYLCVPLFFVCIIDIIFERFFNKNA